MSSGIRGSSEPPIDLYNETSGLRTSRLPIKLAGITMGNDEDELSSVFASRRRRRRSATPVKIGGVVMGDANADEATDTPFGHGNSNKRRSDIGMWGQRRFTTYQEQSNGTDHQGSLRRTVEHRKRYSATPDDLPKLAPISVVATSCIDKKDSVVVSVEETIIVPASPIDKKNKKKKKKKVKEIIKDDATDNDMVTNAHITFLEGEIVEIQAGQVKYHSGETPHPNRFDPQGQQGPALSEANSDDDEEIVDIVEVDPGQVHYHDALRKQAALHVPVKGSTASVARKSPSPHLAIIAGFLENHKATNEEKVVNVGSNAGGHKITNDQCSSKVNHNVNANEATDKQTRTAVQETEGNQMTSFSAKRDSLIETSQQNHDSMENKIMGTSSSTKQGFLTDAFKEHESMENKIMMTSFNTKQESFMETFQQHHESSENKIIMTSSNVKQDSFMEASQQQHKSIENQIMVTSSNANVSTDTFKQHESMENQTLVTSSNVKQDSFMETSQQQHESTENKIMVTSSNAKQEDFFTDTFKQHESMENKIMETSSSVKQDSFMETSQQPHECTENQMMVTSSNAKQEDYFTDTTIKQYESMENKTITSSKQEVISTTVNKFEEATEDMFVVDTKQTKVMEELFDKLVSGQDHDLFKSSSVDSFQNGDEEVSSSVGGGDQGDESSMADSDITDKLVTRSGRRRNSFNNHNEVVKLRNKRKRNRTIDYSSLPGCAFWSGTVAQYTQKSYDNAGDKKEHHGLAVETGCQTLSDTDQSEPTTPGTEKGHQGFGIIIDKLKNIETKLDELKTMDQTVYKSESPVPNGDLPELGDTPTCHQLPILDTPPSSSSLSTTPCARTPNAGATTSDTDELMNASMNHYSIHNITNEGDKQEEEDDDDDDTLKDDKTNEEEEEEEDKSIAEDSSLITELAVDDDNVVVSSPSPLLLSQEDSSPGAKKCRNPQVDIMSISTLSELGDHDDVDIDEDQEDGMSSGRQSRIEELARKILEEEQALAALRNRHSREREAMNLELDTVSERSEIEEEDLLLHNDVTNGTDATEACRKFSRQHSDQGQSKAGSSARRTRSASRERNLAKIKFCWRCHQTGHESFDCTVEMQPAAWCPRCLESSHWEDSCWVNDQEVFCNICTLPGHLPCVHQTNDFRQRKLVIETFGWLAFKEWFKEPEFWSWWNCSGFTNVPLYKLMQHRPHVASPDLQELSEP